MPASRGIAREGYPFLLAALVLTLVTLLGLGVVPGIVSMILPAFVAFFFRDPDRVIPEGEEWVVAPADGKVVGAEEMEDPRYLNGRVRRLSIFLSIFDVHINRIPLSGRVREVRYHQGKFLVANVPKASLDNEQNAVILETAGGRIVAFVQIAGLIARRIVCYLQGGERVNRGERFGLIRFGSRMDLYLPPDAELLVRAGDRVKGGETKVARLI